jgi:hypothetical protein
VSTEPEQTSCAGFRRRTARGCSAPYFPRRRSASSGAHAYHAPPRVGRVPAESSSAYTGPQSTDSSASQALPGEPASPAGSRRAPRSASTGDVALPRRNSSLEAAHRAPRVRTRGTRPPPSTSLASTCGARRTGSRRACAPRVYSSSPEPTRTSLERDSSSRRTRRRRGHLDVLRVLVDVRRDPQRSRAT